jgi:regulator of replication initiation timing
MKLELVRRGAAIVLVWLLTLPAWAADTSLPVRRVVLYKHGVGYFEREGKLAGSGDVTIEFKALQMSDVLKSLTLLGAGGAVTGISYEASDPLSEQLKEYNFTLPKEASIGQVLDQFKGAQLAVRLAAGGEVRGGILGVHRAQVDKSDTEVIALLLDGGELCSVSLREAAGLKLEDPRLQKELETYLRLVSSAQRRDLRLLRIHPGAARELAIGYVVEAPVWKTSYRLVLDPKKPGEALLQGWAIVDNTTAEDWKGVTLALVSGLPVSFTQNLYQAHYVRRPNVPLPSEMAAAPQAHEGSLITEQRAEVAAVAPMSKALRARAADQPMAGMVGGLVAAPAPPRLADAIDYAASIAVASTGRELGELFEYRIDRPVDIPRNQSAMIPFVQTSVKAERVLLYTPGAAGEHPYDALLMENTTGKTLDGGAITVIEGNQYAGEALVETMKTGDNRPVSFAVDLGTRISTVFDSRQNEVFSVKVRRGTVFTRARNVEIRTYTVRNTDTRARKLVVEHPVRPGWKLVGDAKPFETTARHYRFRIELPAQQTVKLPVQEEYEISSSILLTNLTPELLADYVRNKALSPAAQKQLDQMFAVKEQIVTAQKDVQARQEEINELFRDQERLRQNISNLRGVPGQDAQVNAYASKLTAQEKQLEAKNAALSEARGRLRQLQAQLDKLMNSLTIE